VCNPAAIAVASFGVQTAGNIYQYNQEKKAVRYRNRARLLNFNEERRLWTSDRILRDTAWKGNIAQYEANIDDLYQRSLDIWRSQDLEIKKALSQHAFNNVEILQKMYKSESAREQTGVTAQRLEGEAARVAGFALTKSYRDLVLTKDKAWLNKETTRLSANKKQRQAWEQINVSPVSGFQPIYPELESEPGIGGLLMKIGISAATSFLGYKAMKTSYKSDVSFWKQSPQFYTAAGTTAAQTGASLSSNRASLQADTLGGRFQLQPSNIRGANAVYAYQYVDPTSISIV